MNETSLSRRSLFGAAAAAALGTAERPAAAAPAAGKSRILLGCQKRAAPDEQILEWQRYGVTHVCTAPDEPPTRGYWTVDELSRLRERLEKAGLTLAMVWEPFLASSSVDRTPRPAIMLGKSPDRDRDIECFQAHIRNCAAVGVSTVKYNLTLLGVPRTQETPGRGGVTYSTWRLADAGERGKTLTGAGRVPADEYWERITYFLDRVVPVAEQHRVRLACHPQDPGLPPGFQGVDAVLSSVEGLKKFVGIRESPYHGLNFCQGTISEQLRDPGREIHDVIRWFGSRGKIFNVHFRNIRGGRDSFQEVFPDEGSVDMWQAIRTYREVGYQGMLMYDHIPGGPGGRAFAYGYIRALIQASEGA